jgi:Domain of unknown function (DUF4159)/Aerotolerance regulator N-terminal
MLALGPLSFASPLALGGLLVLPVLWWMLRAMPPAPQRVRFPALRFLAQLLASEETARRTPLWLMLLRMLLAALVILAAARPLIEPRTTLAASERVILVVDEGWAAAPGWAERQRLMTDLVKAAERQGQAVLVLPTARTEPPTPPLRPQAAARALETVRDMQPKPWPTDRGQAADALDARAADDASSPSVVYWLSDGVASGGDPVDRRFFEALEKRGPVTAFMPAPGALPMVLRLADDQRAASLSVTVSRAAAGRGVGPDMADLRLVADDNSPIGSRTATFEGDRTAVDVDIELPAEWLGRLGRITIEGQNHAAATFLVDDRWRRRAVGIITDDQGPDTSVLGQFYYLERALAPHADVRKGTVKELLRRDASMLIAVDAVLDPDARDRLLPWVEAGGVLLQFAGPRLARAPADGVTLLPVRLRQGDRAIGGAMSWGKPGTLAPFDAGGPFSGLAVPYDIVINRQVLAEPSIDLVDRTWVRLQDGTPLVTAQRRGEGWLVLVHTTANAEWSNLALSGLFVDMLRRLAALGRGNAPADRPSILAPVELLDGFGRLRPPPADARAIPRSAVAQGVQVTAGPQHPPGFYGRSDDKIALNLAPSIPDPKPIVLPDGVHIEGYGDSTDIDLRPWLLGLALLIAIADFAISIAIRGLLPTRPGGRWRLAGRAGAVFLAAGLAVPLGHALAGTLKDAPVPAASLTTRLAYVITGDGEVDRISQAGLHGLGVVVNRRTAAELGEPVGVDPSTDELAFYPLIYWPLLSTQPAITGDSARRLQAYVGHGGMIVFDTQGRATDAATLRSLARVLDLPPLVPVPADHVLGRAYYLLDAFPGRWTGEPVWVQRGGGDDHNDGVTSVVVGRNDWAGAWAVDDTLRPLFAVVPGGERQRELANRFGINLVMHVLTGNYKADQVHLPAILERLGR